MTNGQAEMDTSEWKNLYISLMPWFPSHNNNQNEKKQVRRMNTTSRDMNEWVKNSFENMSCISTIISNQSMKTHAVYLPDGCVPPLPVASSMRRTVWSTWPLRSLKLCTQITSSLLDATSRSDVYVCLLLSTPERFKKRNKCLYIKLPVVIIMS